MRRNRVRTVTLLVFLAIVLGTGFAILSLGTSTGLTFGGSATRITEQTGTHPLYAQVGWLRNTAPWPITIESVTTNATNATSPPAVFFETSQKTPYAASSKEPVWALTSSKPPFQLDGGSLWYLGFALTPQVDQVAAMTSITVTYSGPLGLQYHSTFSGTRVATASSDLPGGVLGTNPLGDPASLDAYIAGIRAVLTQPDPKTMAQVMGGGATEAQAQAFIASQKAYLPADGVSATIVTADHSEQRIVFYAGSITTGALPPIEVKWSDYRWTIIPVGSG